MEYTINYFKGLRSWKTQNAFVGHPRTSFITYSKYRLSKLQKKERSLFYVFAKINRVFCIACKQTL